MAKDQLQSNDEVVQGYKLSDESQSQYNTGNNLTAELQLHPLAMWQTFIVIKGPDHIVPDSVSRWISIRSIQVRMAHGHWIIS